MHVVRTIQLAPYNKPFSTCRPFEKCHFQCKDFEVTVVSNIDTSALRVSLILVDFHRLWLILKLSSGLKGLIPNYGTQHTKKLVIATKKLGLGMVIKLWRWFNSDHFGTRYAQICHLPCPPFADCELVRYSTVCHIFDRFNLLNLNCFE
jgi:hypothetical protein